MGQYVFGKFRDEAGNYVRVEVRELGGSGGDNLEEITIRSLNANLNGNPQEPYKPFSTTSGEVTLSIHKDKYWARRMVYDILRAGDHGFGIHIYVSNKDDIDRQTQPVFIGFIDINNLSYEDYPHPYDLKLKFYDGLASLRDIDFKTNSAPYEVGGLVWDRSVHDMIFDCINCIPNIDQLIKQTGAPAVTVNCSWFTDNMYLINGDLDNPLEVVAVNPFKWNDVSAHGAIGVFDKAGKVLEEVLARFQLRIYFSGTTFVIEQMSERRNKVVIRHSYNLDGSNYFGTFAPGRGQVHDIDIDREQVHRIAKGGFGYFPAAKEVKVNFNYTNDFSWVNSGDAFDYNSDNGAYDRGTCALVAPKYNYDAPNQRVAFKMRLRVRSEYLIPYVNYSFSHMYVFAFRVMFNDDLVADRKFNENYTLSKRSWDDNRWLDAVDVSRIPAARGEAANPNNPDEISWIANYVNELYDTKAWMSYPSPAITHKQWGQWRTFVIEGYTAPIPNDYKTSNYPLGVCFQLKGLLAQGSGFRTYYEDNINKYIDMPDESDMDWWAGLGSAPQIFKVQYEVEDFAVFLVDQDKNIITDTATRVYSGKIDDKNKKVIEIDTEIGDGPGPLSVSALKVLDTNSEWVLPTQWHYAGISGDIHELQVKELMRFYGTSRRMLTGKVWLKSASETVFGAPFQYRFNYDNGTFLPMQVSYDFKTNILTGSLISVLGEYGGNVNVEVTEYEGVDSKLEMKGGRDEYDEITVDPAAGGGVVQTRKKIGIDSAANNGNTVQVTELAIPEAKYGYFNKGDQIQVTDGNTGRQLVFTVEADVLPDDDTIQVEQQDVGVELGDNSTVMLYQEHFESQAYTDNRRKYQFQDIPASTKRVLITEFTLPDKSIVSDILIRKRLQVHLGSSKAFYGISSYMGYDIDNSTNELVFNESIPGGEFIEVIYDGVRLEK